jgi:hypothetical protein
LYHNNYLQILALNYMCMLVSIPEKQEATHNVSKVGDPPPASAARAQLFDENATALINPVSSVKSTFVSSDKLLWK